MKKFIYSFLLFCVPLLIVLLTLLALPTTPRQRIGYAFASNAKDSLLAHTKSPRIIFIGGSNLAFGLNSQMIKDSLNMNPINMGLHAGLGLQYMMEHTIPLLREGDVVIISPEYQQFGASLVYGSYPMLEAIFNVKEQSLTEEIKQKTRNLGSLSYKQYDQLIKHLPTYLETKLERKEYTDTIFKSSYRAKAFNEYGDNIHHRSHFMNTKPEDLTFDMIYLSSVNYDSFAILEKFHNSATNRGALVYLSLPPLYEGSYELTKEYVEYVIAQLKQTNITLLGDGTPYVVPIELIYDTHYHLNAKGADERTLRGRVSIFHKCYSKPYLFSLSNFAPDSFVDPSPLRYT